MIRRLINLKLDNEEKRLGASLEYVRFILRTSVPAFLRYIKIMPLANYRKTLPVDAYHTARLVATLHEDCGSCAQIEINVAKNAGVNENLLRAIVTGNLKMLPEDLRPIFQFAEAVASGKEPSAEIREALQIRYGDAGLVELALGIAACRVFPTTKRALGYATTCSAMDFEF